MPKIFKIGDCDWVAANNAKEALEWYKDETWIDGITEENVEEVKDLTNFYVIVDRYRYKEFEKDYLENEDDTTMLVPADELLKKEWKGWKGKPYIFCTTWY